MKKYRALFILLNLIILLVYFNLSIVKKEELSDQGQLVLLELAPLDPRSLMQGDYMRLRYKISENLHEQNIPKRGYCVVQLDQYHVAHAVRFQKDPTPLNTGEYLIRYTASDLWNVNIGAESFFFQEGQAEKYDKARYGGIKIDDQGNSLLIGLYDEQQRKIQ